MIFYRINSKLGRLPRMHIRVSAKAMAPCFSSKDFRSLQIVSSISRTFTEICS